MIKKFLIPSRFCRDGKGDRLTLRSTKGDDPNRIIRLDRRVAGDRRRRAGEQAEKLKEQNSTVKRLHGCRVRNTKSRAGSAPVCETTSAVRAVIAASTVSPQRMDAGPSWHWKL